MAKRKCNLERDTQFLGFTESGRDDRLYLCKNPEDYRGCKHQQRQGEVYICRRKSFRERD